MKKIKSINTTSGIADVGTLCDVLACFFLNFDIILTLVLGQVLRLKFSLERLPEFLPSFLSPAPEKRMVLQTYPLKLHFAIQHKRPLLRQAYQYKHCKA